MSLFHGRSPLVALAALAIVALAACAGRVPGTDARASAAPRVTRTCDAHAYGAVGDGLAKDTAALQRAVEACATGDGGTVVLARGTSLSGMLVLHSHVTLRIEGGGTIDGNADIDKWRSMALPEGQRPMAIFTALSTDVSIEGITVRNAATWAVVNLEVEHLVIRGITVDSPHGPTHDGIDVVDGRDVLIEDSTITAGDDGICLKSGSAKGLRDVVVRRNRILGAGVANGLKLGTATVGPMRHILFEDITIANAQAAAMAIESVDGGEVSDLTFRRVTLSDVGTPVFMLLGARGKAAVGAIHDVRFETIRGDRLRYPWGALLTGAPADAAGRHDLDAITFRDIAITYRGIAGARGPHVFGSGAADAARFPVYAGGYPDAKFIFATSSAKSEVIDYALPGYAFFVRNARGVRFDACRVAVDGAETRDAVVAHDAGVVGTCEPEPGR